MKNTIKTKNRHPSVDECMSCPILSGLRDESLCLKCYSKSLVWHSIKRM